VIARQSFAIVGAGLAAGRAVQELRESGFEGHIVLYGAEPHPPYERPPLSKGYLMGTDDFESALVQPLEWYRDQDIDLRLSTTVTTTTNCCSRRVPGRVAWRSRMMTRRSRTCAPSRTLPESSRFFTSAVGL